jgi:hypothetical protein
VPSLVSPAEVAARYPAAASHDQTDLQLIIDANEQLMNTRLSAAGINTGSSTIVQFAYPASVVLLPERVGSITSISEHWLFADPSSDITLDPTDYRLAPDGTAVERLIDGPNSRDTFGDEITIEYVGFDTLALRKNVLMQLVLLDLSVSGSGASGNANSVLTSRRLGDYAETFSSGASAFGGGIAADKENILAQLAPALPLFA